MIRLVLTTAVLAAVLCFVNDVHAFDVKNKFMVSALGGLSVPVGDFADVDTSNAKAGAALTGFNLGAAIEYGITNEFLIGGRFAYNRFSVDDAILADGEANWSVIEIFGIYGKYLIPTGTSTRPYGRAGLFVGKPELKFDGADGFWSGEYDASLGLEAAIGITHMISARCGIGLEARFAHLCTSASDDDVTATSAFRSAGAYGPTGVRDPGGNLDWLAVDGYVTYGL